MSANTLRGKTTKEVAEEIREENPEANIGLDITPSINTLNKYNIDANQRLKDVQVVLKYKCDCGVLCEIDVIADYSRPISADLEARTADTSD